MYIDKIADMDLVGNEYGHAHTMLSMRSLYALSLSLFIWQTCSQVSEARMSVIQFEYVAVACQVRLFLRTLQENPAEGQKA